MTKAKSHLLKHEVPEIVDSNFHFGTDDKKEIARQVAAMGQRQLQEKFKTVYQKPTGSNNNNWLRRKLLEAAGCQEAKVVGMGNTSPRKKGVGIGEIGMDGGASYRTENGMRRTKRPRKPKQNSDFVGEDSFEGGRHRDGRPLSTGDAYLQGQQALYKAGLGHGGLPGAHDFHTFPSIALNKHFTGHNPFSMGQAFPEVHWPGPRGRPDESNSSSEDQTAYEHGHSMHSHQSRDGGPVSPRTQLTRNLEDTMALLAGHAHLAPASQAQLRMHASVPGMPSLPWDDCMRYSFSGSAPPGFQRQPNSPSNAYMAQMMRQSSANKDERVGGNTPLLDTEDPLFDGPILGHSSATDSLLFNGRLSPLEGNLLPSASNSPILPHDLANMFNDSKTFDMGRRSPLLNPQSLGLFDLPGAGRLGSMDRVMGDMSPSHLLSDTRAHMPAAPPPTPVSHGMGSPRYHAGLEGMAAPSHRFTGAHIPADMHFGEHSMTPRFVTTGNPVPNSVSPRAPIPRFNASAHPTPASPRAAASPRVHPPASPSHPGSPRARAAPVGLSRHHRSSSLEHADQRLQMPALQSMVVRTLSTPEPLSDAMLQPQMESNPTPIQSVMSLGAWNVNEAPPHMDIPALSTPELKVPRGAPAEAELKEDMKRVLDTSLPSLSGQPGQAVPAPAAEMGEAVQCKAEPVSGAAIAAQLLSESASLPTIAEEEPNQAPTPAEGEHTLSQQLTA